MGGGNRLKGRTELAISIDVDNDDKARSYFNKFFNFTLNIFLFDERLLCL